ncbi:MAG: DUF4147 domain-containing protein [Candidatus Kaiserbacteria bacterium]|nr:DUF4147 domain-containing protein [Candidatus Kaiserbacteria bacterium]
MGRVIQNFDTLAENSLRRDALAIAEAGYEAINVGNALRNKLRIENDELILDPARCRLAGRRVFFVGVGKCALVAAEEIEKIFGDSLAGGIALDVSSHEQKLKKIEAIIGSHPLPSEKNVEATKRIIEFLSDRREDDLVIMVISGGGSTLLCLPESPMTYADEPSTKSDLVLGESALFKELTSRGAPIQDMNIVRKHISSARGGGLARAAYPAEVISLIISDVPGNDIEFISSGPTILDNSTVADAKEILKKYDIASAENISLIETPKEVTYFERVTNILFLSSSDALVAMQNEAAKRGYQAEITDDHFSGEARDVGRNIIEKLHDAQPKTALLYAGESTVTLNESQGIGGRNQEMALATLSDIRDDELILPFASDGHDNTDHAGAIGDIVSRAHADIHKLSVKEYLDAHRSYDFFSKTGDALITGYTGSNVSDLIIALKK